MSESPETLGQKKSPMPTPVDLFDVALDGASKALPVLMTILTNAGLKNGAMVADEIAANVNCALKVYRERRLQFLNVIELERALAASQVALREAQASGWLIERADSSPAQPKYWAAGQRDAERTSAWTSNHMEAIRFARREDAEKVVQRLFPKIAVRIAEHGWDAAIKASESHERENHRCDHCGNYICPQHQNEWQRLGNKK